MDEVKQEQKKQSRTFSVILYPDTDTYDTEEVLTACCEYFSEWAYILHDKDTLEDGSLKKPHYHVVGRLEGSRTPQTVANCIGVPANYVDCKKGYTFKKGVRYLAHLDNPEKAQYDYGLISSNVELVGYLNPYNDVSQARAIFDKATRESVDDVRALAQWAFDEGCYAEFRRNYSFWRDLCRINKDELNEERMR